MTCTTHHICGCQKERMKKLEKVVDVAKDIDDELTDSELKRPRYAVLREAIAALEDLK